MKPWKRIEPTKVTKVGWRTVTTKTFVLNSGQTASFEVFGKESNRCAAIIAITADNKVVVARQFRPGPEKVLDELPGGFVEPDEDPKTAAIRELREEVGYDVGAVEYLGGFTTKDAYMQGEWHFYLARDCRKVTEQKLENTEEVEIAEITIDQLIHNALNDKMTDSIAVFRAYDKLIRLKDK
jgi:ADP-ribose pyrophosphatase